MHLDFLRGLARRRRLDEHLDGLVTRVRLWLGGAVLDALALVVRGAPGRHGGDTVARVEVGLFEHIVVGGNRAAGMAPDFRGEDMLRSDDVLCAQATGRGGAVDVIKVREGEWTGCSVGPKEVGRSAGGARWVLKLGSRG